MVAREVLQNQWLKLSHHIALVCSFLAYMDLI